MLKPNLDSSVDVTLGLAVNGVEVRAGGQTDAPSHTALAAVFNRTFGEEFNVRCVGGYPQPEYLPAAATHGPAQLRYTRDYPASALHEVAHWCIAGKARLKLPDFGYDYLQPPRDSATQAQFFALEFKAQLLEAWFARGTSVRFVASADNFECTEEARCAFAQQIEDELGTWTLLDLPWRAKVFSTALAAAGLGVWPGLISQLNAGTYPKVKNA